MKSFIGGFIGIFLATSASAGWFDVHTTSDEDISLQMEKLMLESDKQVGIPAITQFTEKRMVRWLYELRDQPNYRTYSYIVTLEGKFVKICDSVGYGISASIQYSNPEKVIDEGVALGYGYAMLPQAEPNGLFMPDGLAATYVMCVQPGTEEVSPVYIEPEVIVSPFPLP